MVFRSPAELSKTLGGNDSITAPVSLVDPLVLTQSASGTLSFSGGISGAGGITKEGAGTVVFSTANTYTGTTTLADGLLRLDNSNGLPGGIDNAAGAGESLLLFKGGVLGLYGDFTRQLGTGAGQLNWDPDTGGAGSGGFAAFGADRMVKLNNNTNTCSWYSVIIGNGNTLILGHPTATHTLDFKNGIYLSEEADRAGGGWRSRGGRHSERTAHRTRCEWIEQDGTRCSHALEFQHLRGSHHGGRRCPAAR